MPELPEVHTTVQGIIAKAKSLSIVDVWTNYGSRFHRGKKNIKDKAFFGKFKKAVIGKKIIGASRRGKNVLIHLSGDLTILVHMKMTGHFLYGSYRKEKNEWVAKEDGPLQDPFNRFVRVVFTLSNKKHLVLSDLRKFAKVTFFHDHEREHVTELSVIGPEPLEKNFTVQKFTERLKLRPNAKIKQVLMDQSIIAGIGNIYSDEILWKAGVHPARAARSLSQQEMQAIYRAMKTILRESIRVGGDSASDYRNIEGNPGGFQHRHYAYRQTGKRCKKSGCSGTIQRLVIGGRSAHFCDTHQRTPRN